MINEDRVKELCEIAHYDDTKEKDNRQMGQYYRHDYIGKEMIISFFTGSIAFVLLLVLWALYASDELLANINQMDILALGISIIWKYVAFMVVYEMITYVVSYLKYSNGRRELKKYYGHLKKVNKMYDREEKLRMPEDNK